jgi:hypothetical protein
MSTTTQQVVAHLIGTSGCARFKAKLYYNNPETKHVVISYAEIIVRNGTSNSHVHNTQCSQWPQNLPTPFNSIPVRLTIRCYCFNRNVYIIDTLELITEDEIRELLDKAHSVHGFTLRLPNYRGLLLRTPPSAPT